MLEEDFENYERYVPDKQKKQMDDAIKVMDQYIKGWVYWWYGRGGSVQIDTLSDFFDDNKLIDINKNRKELKSAFDEWLEISKGGIREEEYSINEEQANLTNIAFYIMILLRQLDILEKYKS